jgi:hypothetical protein
MWKGIPFLNSQQDETKLRRNLRQSQYNGLDIVAFKDQYYLRQYIESIIKDLDSRPLWVYKDIDSRNTDRIKDLEDKIYNFKGPKSELRKLINQLKSIEGYNPLRDLKDNRLK